MATSSYNTQQHPLPTVPHDTPQSYYQKTPRSQQQQHQQQQQQQQFQQQQQYVPQGQQAQYYQYQQQAQSPSQQQPFHSAGPAVRDPAQQELRPKTRGLSFRSEKSHHSSHSAGKNSLQETHAEKEAKRIHSKADPTLAMQEAEPSAIAAQGADKDAALRPLSSIQHKGFDGMVIADPDRSNPTRSRWERPLETIRSFEAAVDGAYNRKSFYRSESESALNGWNRRTSQYGNQNGPRFPQNSYYSSRPQSVYRPESVIYDTGRADGSGPDGYFDGNDHRRNRYSRMQSESQVNRRNVYPMSNSYQSHETVASGSGSEPAGYSTDPSSENSSMGRRSPPKRQEPNQDYGINFGNQNGSDNRAFAPSSLSHATNSNPTVPRKDVGPNGSMLRKPLKNAGPPPVSAQQARPSQPEKRKSWLARRFSKKE